MYFKPRRNTRFFHRARQTYILSIYKNILTFRLGSEMNHPQICRQKIIIFVYEFNLLLNDFFFIFTVSEAYTGGGQWHKNDQVSKIRGGRGWIRPSSMIRSRKGRLMIVIKRMPSRSQNIIIRILKKYLYKIHQIFVQNSSNIYTIFIKYLYAIYQIYLLLHIRAVQRTTFQG